MTDREKLTKLILDHTCVESEEDDCGGHRDCSQCLADYLIANGVTFQKWIPVSERLPEDDLPKDSKRKSIKVLVTYKTSSGVPVVRTQVREKDPWYGGNGWAWTKWEPITHWMPLPNPPKEEDK